MIEVRNNNISENEYFLIQSGFGLPLVHTRFFTHFLEIMDYMDKNQTYLLFIHLSINFHKISIRHNLKSFLSLSNCVSPKALVKISAIHFLVDT